MLPFILRRVKSDVLSELPEKVIQDQICELSDLQRALYEAVVERCSLKETEATQRENYASLTPLQTLITLRKLVDHPVLIGEIAEKIGVFDKVAEAVREPTKAGSYSASLENDVCKFQELEASGKMVALREILEECQIGRQSSSSTDESSLITDGGTHTDLSSPSNRIRFFSSPGHRPTPSANLLPVEGEPGAHRSFPGSGRFRRRRHIPPAGWNRAAE